MEPESEDPGCSDDLSTWTGSDGSQKLCVPESLAESSNDDDDNSKEENSFGMQTLHMPTCHSESQERFELHDWASANKQESSSEHIESKATLSYQENDDINLCGSRELITESPYIHTSNTSFSSEPQDSKPQSGQISWQHSQSSSSSLGSTTDVTQALTPTTKRSQETSNRHGPGTGNRRVESSEEGGSSEAPPASVFFGISDEGAEQAEKWNSGSDTDLCRPGRSRARFTRVSYSESQSERRLRETKSECKRIAKLLTDAPNPRNKGALLFKKRFQRVKKYTLVSYGTGVDKRDQIEGESGKVRSAEYNFVATSDSEPEEPYCFYHLHYNLSLAGGSVQEMEELPETRGKGVFMFAQRRKRMDELVSEHEEQRSKGPLEDATVVPQNAGSQNVYDTLEMHKHLEETSSMDINLMKHLEYHENIQQTNHLSNMPKPLVPNRTAKPFKGLQVDSAQVPSPGSVSPSQMKHEPRFKVPVPTNTNPKVWSPTGDIIASRDERISVPAIKTGILPESKRKGSGKQLSTMTQNSDPHNQNKGERRSYIESEEDFFSLGAEACNFMQTRTVKLKNPPPVAPKPIIDPSCPPWLRRSPSSEPFVPPRSPVTQLSHSPAGSHSQHYLQQQDLAQSQQMASRWAPDQTPATLQTPANAWDPVSSPSQLHLQGTTNSWSQKPAQSPVSIQAQSPSYGHYSPQQDKSESVPNSSVSCPSQDAKLFVPVSKSSQLSPKGRIPHKGIKQAGDGSPMAGKGAELFAKRQSRMERFVVDAETVQANKTRSQSPSLSLPNSWRYSSNIRAPPPLSYNPLLSPFYPASTAKQPPSTSPKIKPKTKGKSKSAPKQLNALDIMKHQPYQLDSSLFKYDAASEEKSPSPKPTPVSKFEKAKSLKQKSASSHFPHNTSEPTVQNKTEAPAKFSGPVFSRSRSLSLPRRMNSLSSPGLLSPASTPGFQPSFLSAQRQASFQEKTHKPPTPWEAASRSPIGSVDEAFMFPSLPSSFAHQRSVPKPPDEWRRRVSLDPTAVSKGHYGHVAPPLQAAPIRRNISPEKPAFHGPPFRPAQPLRHASRPSAEYRPQSYSPRNYFHQYSAVQ
ncbi:synaptopodin-2 [Menidia menidia]